MDLTTQEAMLIDWVLTQHSFSLEQLEWLSKPQGESIRLEAGRVFLANGGSAHFNRADIDLLLKLVPVTFRFGEADVGFTLKKKLYWARLSRPPKLDLSLPTAPDQTSPTTNEGATNAGNDNKAENQASRDATYSA